MARNEHDIVRDHFGVLEEAQLADGTATAGYAPLATGTGTAEWGAVSAAAGDTVKVSANDTTAGYLNGKLVAGSGIILTENADGSDESLTIYSFSTPINWTGAWAAGTYDEGDGVTHDGSSYVALTTTTDEPPSADWQLVAQAGTGTGGVGKQLIAVPPGYSPSATAQSPTASAAFAYPILISTEMELRAFAAALTSSAAGTYQWGLFDFSSSVTACTKLAGGSGSMAGTGVMTIAASGGPITVSPGSYILIWLVPAASQGQISRFTGASGPLGGKVQTSYAWDDTPDLTSGWTATTLAFNVWLTGDLDASGTQW